MADTWDLIQAARAAREAAKPECTCEYISPGAAALHAMFNGIDGPLPKVLNPLCPVHGLKARKSC